MEVENLSVYQKFDFSQGVRSETLVKKIGFLRMILGVPETGKLGNFAPLVSDNILLAGCH